MALDVTRVTVLGGGKRKVATKDRRGAVTERYDVRRRVQLRSAETRMFRQRFDRSVDADSLVRRLRAVGLPASGWHLDDDGRPSDEPVSVGSRAEGLTVWSALQLYRSATWRGASANGRKSAALTLRTTARLLKPNAPHFPLASHAYLDLVAFRGAVEPATADELAEKYEYRGGVFSAADLLIGRVFLERWSLPVADLDCDHVRRLIAELGHGRAAATEGRRWTQLRAVLRWWHVEGVTDADLTTRLGVIRGTSIPTLGDDEAVPDEREMWLMAWALCLVGKPQFAALPLVMGGAGLRIGECCELRRRDCVDGPNGGMWTRSGARWPPPAARGPTPATESSDEVPRRKDPTATCAADGHTFSLPRRRCCVPTSSSSAPALPMLGCSPARPDATSTSHTSSSAHGSAPGTRLHRGPPAARHRPPRVPAPGCHPMAPSRRPTAHRRSLGRLEGRRHDAPLVRVPAPR